MDDRHCPNCGEIVLPDLKVCPYCGTQLAAESAAAEASVYSADDPVAAPPPVERTGEGRIKVLYVEDDDLLRRAVSAKLAHEGFDVKVAVDGSEALVVLNSFTPDVILLDLYMEGLDGLRFLKALNRGKLPDIKIVIYSNYDDETLRRESSELGANLYLLKVTTPLQKLAATLKELVGKRS